MGNLFLWCFRCEAWTRRGISNTLGCRRQSLMISFRESSHIFPTQTKTTGTRSGLPKGLRLLWDTWQPASACKLYTTYTYLYNIVEIMYYVRAPYIVNASVRITMTTCLYRLQRAADSLATGADCVRVAILWILSKAPEWLSKFSWIMRFSSEECNLLPRNMAAFIHFPFSIQ